jgi:phosphoenolpyruvate-protein kinase (PTS system EI component)
MWNGAASACHGVCGNLAADPRSIRAFDALGVDHISVPVARLARARLAAAQV